MLEYFKNQIVQTFLQWHHQSPLLALPTLNPTPQRKPLPIISVLRAPGGFFPTVDGMFLPPFLDLLTTDTVYWLPTTKYSDLYSYHMQRPFLFTSQLLHWVLKWHSSFKIIHANQYVLFLLYQVIFLPSCSTQKIHGHQFFFQLLCHLFHTPHAPHFHSCTCIIIQTDIIYIVLSNPGSALHCVVSITKAFRDQTGHVCGSTCPGVIAGRSMKTTANYKVSNSKTFTLFQKSKSIYSSSSAVAVYWRWLVHNLSCKLL